MGKVPALTREGITITVMGHDGQQKGKERKVGKTLKIISCRPKILSVKYYHFKIIFP